MASQLNHHVRNKIAILLLLLWSDVILAKSAKPHARPVHETINEQNRSDQEKSRTTPLPYGNPLAGNSQHNTRQHALHQQAMFNAERTRQHRAQLQRWTTAPQKMDSYMKAYHELQESHHLALEKQLSKPKDAALEHKSKQKLLSPVTVTPVPHIKHKQNHRPQHSKRSKADAIRITKADALVNKQDKNRNHRSYGSTDYYNYPTKYQTVYIHPNYDQGVTIKPNGNVGSPESYSQEIPQSMLYTTAIPSNTQSVFPKQYSQMQAYQSANDIASLSSLLKKGPNDQLSGFNALIESSNHTSDEQSPADVTELHQPIDLYFYLKDNPSSQSASEQYEQPHYGESPISYAQAYSSQHSEPSDDHKPIKEEVDDIADPNHPHKIISHGVKTILTPQIQSEPDTSTIKSNNYYKVEVASQTISAYKPVYHSQVKQPVEYVLQNENENNQEPTYQTLHYGKQPLYYYKDQEKDSEDSSNSYVQSDPQYKGIQHLTGDGTGVSAYDGDSENLHYASNYEFGYRVKDQHTGNDFGHHEAKSGEKTNGHYHVLLPDGRLQKVKYWAGPSGFHADISYDHLQEHSQLS